MHKIKINFRKWAWEINKIILICVIFLELLGTLTILRLSFIMSNRFKASYDLIFFLKHLFFIVISFLNLFIFSYMPWSKTKKVCWWLFFIALFLDFLTVGIGTKVNGVRRWIRIGGFSFQSSEIVKVLVVFPVSKFLSEEKHNKTMLIISISALSCLIQPDLGMTFLIISSASSLVFLNGKNLKAYIKILVFAFIGILISGIFLATYASNRLLIFFGKKEGFQISQSLKLFASSKLIGEDINNIYVPDSHCDFMFAEIVSGFGFIAGLVVIVIPIILINVVILKYKNFKNEEKLIAIGIVNQFSIQTFLHILSNLAFIPTKGLNLPFASFGGSALMAHSIGIGALLCLYKKKLRI